jgi:hypothetical protein
VHGGHGCADAPCTTGCEPVLIRERTAWGWIDWTVPADGSLPERPHRITVFTSIATRAQHLALRRPARRGARRIRVGPVTLRTATAVVAALSLAAATLTIIHGVPFSIVLLAAALAPLLVEHLADPLDIRAHERGRIVQAEAACPCLQRLAALHAGLVRAAAGSDRYQLRRAVETSHHQLFDTADLLTRHDTLSASSELIAREQLILQLASRTSGFITRIEGDAPATRRARTGARQCLGPCPPGPRRQPRTSAQHATRTSWKKEETPMPQDRPEQQTLEVYLLFAHEAYYPAAGREINTSLVAAASLLHPRVRQPDGARIHDLLTRGRRPREIVPRDTSGDPADAEKSNFTYSYDLNGNLTQLDDTSSTAKIDSYAITYTGLDQVQKVTESLAGVEKKATSYTYDVDGKPETITHPDQFSKYTYDLRELVKTVSVGKSATDASPKVTSYTYTDRGLKLQQTKANGNTVDYAYYLDAALKSTTEKKPNGTLVDSAGADKSSVQVAAP